MIESSWRVTIGLLFCSILVACLSLPARSVGATLDTHTVVLDAEGKIIPWTPDPAQGYDRVMFLSWDLLKNHIPLDPANGLPVTYTQSEYDADDLSGTGWPNNPGSKNAALADSAEMYYAYSGDQSVIDLVRGLLDHHLQYGTTPANYAWAKVPWSSAAGGSITYGNDSARDGVGVLQPDKVGELGYYGYLKFYQLTGSSNYLNAALSCANALAQHVRDGDATHSPWPFRVVAQTGATAEEEYSAHVIAPIALFDELTRLGLGDTNAYGIARQKAWNWLITYPMSNHVWVNYSEDIVAMPDLNNFTQFIPGYTARYLLEHPELDPDWFNHVTNLLEFIETTFGGMNHGEPGLQYGARVISEQSVYDFKMASHTSRFGSLNAMLYEAAGDLAVREKGYRSLNWSTYMCRSNGVVIEGPAEFANDPPCWFTDGHGDYIRHFMLALGAVPEWAPAGQNHLTRSTSVIRSVTYAPGGDSIAYTTFDEASTETLRVAFTPVSVIVNGGLLPQRSDLNLPGWVFTASNSVLRLRHDTGTGVQILSASASNQPPAITTTSLPNGTMNLAYSVALAANGGATPYTWSIASGALPSGLTLNPNTGMIAGTPASSGSFNFTAGLNDFGSPVQSVTQALSILVIATPTTVGNTNDGTLTDSMSANSISAMRYLATGNITVDTLRAKVGAITGKYKCAIYTDNNGLPGVLLGGTAEVQNPGAGWQSFALTAPLTLTNVQYYWLAIWANTGASIYYSDGYVSLRYGTYTYGAWPSPLTLGTIGIPLNYSIYATGTVASPPTLISTGKVQLQGFTGTGPRTVQFVASDGPGVGLQTNDVSLSFAGSPKVADYVLNVPTNTAWLSAKTAWNLRRRQTVTFLNGVATNNFTGTAGQLLGGDISQDNNLVNTADYTVLKGNWLKSTAGVDLTGDGLVNTTDYTILKGNWLKTGDPQ